MKRILILFMLVSNYLFSQTLIKDFVLDNEITDGYEVNSISISHDGSTISFSEKPIFDYDPNSNCGLFNKVVLFKYENNQYIKKGNTINATYQNCGDYSEPGFGDNISLGQTGNMVVINSEDHYSSTPTNTFCEFSGTGTNLYIFKYDQNQWTQQKHLWDPENDGYSNCVYDYFSVSNTYEFCCAYDYYEVYINEKEYNQYDVKMKWTKDTANNGFFSFKNENLDYNGSNINGFVQNGYTEIGYPQDRTYFVFDEDLDVMLKSNSTSFVNTDVYVEFGSKLTFLKLNNGVWEEHLSPIERSTIPPNPLDDINGFTHPLNNNIDDNLGSLMAIYDNGESVIITTGQNNNVVFYLVWENNGWILKQSFDNTTSYYEYNETVLGDLSNNGLWLTLKVEEPNYDSDYNRYYYYNYRKDPVTKEYLYQNKISAKDVGVDYYLFISEVQISNNGKLLIKYRSSTDGDLLKVYDVNSNNTTQDSDGDGVTDDVDTCPDTQSGDSVDENGCSDSQKDTDGDGVTDDVDTCPHTPTGETVNENGCQIDNEINNFPWMNDLEGGNDGVTLNLYFGGTIGVNWYSDYGINESSCLSFEIPNNYDYSSELYGYQITPTFRVNDNSSDLFKVNVRSFYGNQISWFPVVRYENSFLEMLDPDGNQFGEITTHSQNFQEYTFDISHYENMNIQVGIYLTGVFSSSFYLLSDNWEIGNSTDQNQNTFEWINYGTQDWSIENAEVTHYRDGTPIPQVTDSAEWANLTTGAWCYNDNDPSKGKLYNWYAVMGIHDNDENTPNKEFAPEGWRVPSDEDWTTLENYLISNGYNYDGTTTGNKIAKSLSSNSGWNSSTNTGTPGNDQSTNNSSGFNAFPESGRDSSGSFGDQGGYVSFWSSTDYDTSDAWIRMILYNYDSGLRSYFNNYRNGSSVRFVRDVDPNDIDNDTDGYSENQGDCDDNNAQVNPGVTEVEDGIDNDCDGEIDEGFNQSGTVTDIDGNTYDYITYGDQVWTVKNAELVTYRDGTPIPQVTDDTEWSNLTTGAWCYYDNDPSKGKLYNWYAVMGIHDNDENTPNKEFAPEGWHIPTYDEWTTLENYLISNGYNYDSTTTGNKIAKSMASTTGWNNSTETGSIGNDQSTNNSSGFNAFPKGHRSSWGSFWYEGYSTYFWSSTSPYYSDDTAWVRNIFNTHSSLLKITHDFEYGNSVRFVRDSQTASIPEIKSNISIYPNPTNNIINIDFNDYKSSELFSIDGKSVLKSTSKQIDLSKEVRGIYFFVIEDINGKKSNGIKVIKE